MSLIVVIAILALAWQLIFKGRNTELRLGVPVHRIVSADMGIDVPPSALFSKKHRVMGSPDYVVEDRPLLAFLISNILRRSLPGAYMPVEVKSANVHSYRVADLLQLLTYCFLLEENGLIVNRGRLKYANIHFDFPYGPAERQEVLRVLEEMREAERLTDLQCFAPANDRRCKGCELKSVCFRRG